MHRWHVASRGECSAHCGLGYRTLDIYCAKYSRLDGKTERVDDSFCSSHPKPSNQEKCAGECNMGGWRYSAWTEVSWFFLKESLLNANFDSWWWWISEFISWGCVEKPHFAVWKEYHDCFITSDTIQILQKRIPWLICDVWHGHGMWKIGRVGTTEPVTFSIPHRLFPILFSLSVFLRLTSL